MVSELWRHVYFIGIVLILLVLSILLQIIIGALYQKILRETDNMALTENRLLKQCKLKFSNCYELNNGTVNIPVFVDRFLNQIQFAGISLTSMAHLSGQFMLLAVFAAGVGACRGIIEGDSMRVLLPYYIVSLFGLYLYFSVSSLVDARGKRNMVRINLIDYLENHLRKHLELVQQEEMQPYLVRNTEEEEKAHPEDKPRFADGEEEELEALLREFLA